MIIPLHLGVHLLGLAVATGLVLLSVGSRRGPGAAVIASGARLGVALGGALLVASHLLVGALLAPVDGWPLLLRTAGYAALAVGAAGGVGSRVAVIALVPPVAPLAAGLAGLAAAVAAARGVLGQGRQAIPLAMGVAAWGAADLLVARPAVAGGLSVVGSLTAGIWVARRVSRRSLAGRTAAAYLAVLVALVVGLAGASGTVLAADVRAEQVERLTAVAVAQAGDLVDRAGATLEATASAFAGATIVRPLEAGDEADAAEAAARVTALPDVDLVVVTDRAGSVVGTSSTEGELAAAAALAIAGSPAVGAALDGEVARAVVDLGDGDLAVVGAVPVVPTAADGDPIALRQVGSLVVGRLLTAPAVVERVAADTAGDAAVVVGGQVVASTFTTDVTLDPAAARGEAGITQVAGSERVVASAPLGEPGSGRLVLALPPDASADAGDTAVRTSFLLAMVGLVAAGAVATVVARRIVGPVGRLTDAAEQVAAGDLTTRAAVDREDEVGRLATAFDRMTVAVERRERDLRDALSSQRALRDRLETVTGSMGEALVATDPDGRLTTVNRAACALLGDTASSLIGRDLREVLVGRADGGLPLASVLLDASEDVRMRGELDDGRRLVDATASRLPTSDGDDGRVVVLRDITEQALADRLRTEVIANLSHELNTPLTPIKAFLEVVAARDGVEIAYRPMLDLARAGGTRLERSITALVDLAELEAGKREATIGAVAVDRLVGDTVTRWRPRLEDRSITRRVARPVPTVRTDAALAERILDELVDNAVKFGTGPIRVVASRIEHGQVRVSVRDGGPGIPAERIGDVLEPFTQADGSSTRTVGGLGIGLPLAVRLAELVGARIDLITGGGAGFDASLVLPADPASPVARGDGS